MRPSGRVTARRIQAEARSDDPNLTTASFSGNSSLQFGLHRVVNGIPDMRFINREVPIAEVARALDLTLDGASKIHCWHPDRHQHGDRTASVGIRASNNTVKCFACDSRPLGPIDQVMDVLGITSAADAALWIAERFAVPFIPAHKKLKETGGRRQRVGYEQGLGLLIRSGLWAQLSGPARSIAAVLIEYGEQGGPLDDMLHIQIAYRSLTRFSGVQLPNAIRKALVELSEVGFVRLPSGEARRSPDRQSAKYVVTPNSNELWELAQMVARQTQQEIDAEIELRARLKKDRIQTASLKRNAEALSRCVY